MKEPTTKTGIHRSGSHNIMREPELAGSHKKSENRPTLRKPLIVYVGWLGHKLIIFWNFACHAKKLNEALKHNQ
jgi:hypothetical protein